MATAEYLIGRRRYQRPQALLWSENPGTLVDGVYLPESPDTLVDGEYVPDGYEIQGNYDGSTDANLVNQFLILSDHNRGELNFTPTRIEQRQRTINGRMRSYHIADKLTMSVSWSNLPSRGYYQNASFDEEGLSAYKNTTGEFTSDGGAGGVELLNWYERHTGPFWMFLAYDKYSNFGKENEAYGHLAKYNQIMQVYITDFNYSVVKRGGSNHDLWNISVSLEEV
jgi:hypothetical protein